MVRRPRMANVVGVVCVFWLASTCDRAAQAQTCPPIVTEAPAHTVTILVKTYSNTCTVTDGGYIKTNVNYKLHERAQIWGKCQPRTWHSGQCQNLTLQTRYLNGAVTYINGTSEGTIAAAGSARDFDTTVPIRASSGAVWNPDAPGTYAYTSTTSQTSPTNCSFPAPGPADNQPVTMHALQCEPKFLDDGDGDIPHLGVPLFGDRIEVALPTTMAAAASDLDAAITDWNTRVSGVGIEFERVTSCMSGPRCINVETASIASCGFAVWGIPDAATGEHTGGLKLQLHPNWSTFSSASLRRTFTHELGHFLGLDNYTTSCATNDAMMQQNFACGSGSSPAYTVTINDYLPVTNTTYGGNTKLSCGF